MAEKSSVLIVSLVFVITLLFFSVPPTTTKTITEEVTTSVNKVAYHTHEIQVDVTNITQNVEVSLSDSPSSVTIYKNDGDGWEVVDTYSIDENTVTINKDALHP